MTQTVPDISPLMPMHQDPLLVLYWGSWDKASTHSEPKARHIFIHSFMVEWYCLTQQQDGKTWPRGWLARPQIPWNLIFCFKTVIQIIVWKTVISLARTFEVVGCALTTCPPHHIGFSGKVTEWSSHVFSAANLALAGFPLTNALGESMPSRH